MKKHLLPIVLLLLLAGALAAEVPSVAVILKTTGEARLRRSGQASLQQATRGQRLYFGDQIITGADGTVSLIFQDDKSQLKVRPETQHTLGGTREGRDVEKNLDLELGKIWVQVTHGAGSFRIATPTSVASVKGTRFWVTVDGARLTRVVTLEGVVSLRHLQSGREADVGPGITGDSFPDGRVEIHPTTPAEQQEYSNRAEKEMRIPMRNKQGELRTLVIRYFE